MKITCQVIIVGLLALSFFYSLKQDIEGRDAKPPLGFGGAIGTVIITALLVICYWKAGAFSEVMP